jgi:hypothetical protein
MAHKNTPKHFRLMTDQHGRLLGHIQSMNQSLHLADMIIKLKFGAKISKETGKILFIKSSLVNLSTVSLGLLGNMDLYLLLVLLKVEYTYSLKVQRKAYHGQIIALWLIQKVLMV